MIELDRRNFFLSLLSMAVVKKLPLPVGVEEAIFDTDDIVWTASGPGEINYFAIYKIVVHNDGSIERMHPPVVLPSIEFKPQQSENSNPLGQVTME